MPVSTSKILAMAAAATVTPFAMKKPVLCQGELKMYGWLPQLDVQPHSLSYRQHMQIHLRNLLILRPVLDLRIKMRPNHCFILVNLHLAPFLEYVQVI